MSPPRKTGPRSAGSVTLPPAKPLTDAAPRVYVPAPQRGFTPIIGGGRKRSIGGAP